MGSYQDLLDAVARVRVATGDPAAWLSGLSADDVALVTSPLGIVAPRGIDGVLAKIRAAHPDVFTPPRTAPPPPAAAAPQQGVTADTIRTAETALAQQDSRAAQVDLQVVTAVLNAHTTHDGGRAALDRLQNDVESAVLTRPDLGTPAGAREFQRFLTGKLRDIRTVVETVSLDATSEAALAAALASLYATPASVTDAAAPTPTESPSNRAGPMPERTGEPVTDPADSLLDELLAAQPAPPAAAAPVPPAAAPPVPQLPLAGSAPVPTPSSAFGGLPSPAFGGLPSPAFGGLPPTYPAVAAPKPADDTALAEPPDDAASAGPDGQQREDPAEPDPGPGQVAEPTVVRLPDGQTVTAASPELAAAISAAVAGTPIAEAFQQQGITIPPPGTAVADPVDPTRLEAGDIGMLADRYALALGNGKAVFDNQIQPTSSVAGAGFLGWEHPPRPGAHVSSGDSDLPTPTRPAVTAGPS